MHEIMHEITIVIVCFQMLDFETSNSKSFSKTTLLQRELLLTMFYTINSSTLLSTKKGLC